MTASELRCSRSSFGGLEAAPASDLRHPALGAIEAAMPVSWGDPLNYCEIVSAELRNGELLVVASVSGVLQPPDGAEVITPGPRGLRLPGRSLASSREGERADGRRESGSDEGDGVLWLSFDCPDELQRAEDVFFCYAPGYSTVSILELILASLAEVAVVTPRTAAPPAAAQAPSRLLPATSTGSLLDDLPSEAGSQSSNVELEPCSGPPAQQNGVVEETTERKPQWPQTRASSEVCNAQEPSFAGEEFGKREDGFTQRRQAAARLSWQPPSATRADALCSSIEGGHAKIAAVLARRLRGARSLSACWPSGDAGAMAATLHASRDEALAAEVLRRLSDQSAPLQPWALGRLLPVAQRAAQSECEEHAVAAMRFVLWALEVSWPLVSRGLRDVATSRTLLDACQEATAQLKELFAVIKNMARSVRVSRTNGPLSSVCKKLKSSLEAALAAEGRVPGRPLSGAPSSARPVGRPAGGMRERLPAQPMRAVERRSAEVDF